MELMQASNQWANRPSDQRFTSLIELSDYAERVREHSRAAVVSNRAINVEPADDNAYGNLAITGPNGHAYEPTHWAFGQLANLAGAPAGYLRTLPTPIVADAMNYGLKFKRDVDEVGVLLTLDESADLAEIRAATGPNYGRVWNADIASMLVDRFGDGVSGQWKVPGEFGHDVTVNRENTTLYASDRDMFVFLADEKNRIEVPNRRDGIPGNFARGFFVWNSEVGSSTLGAAFFLFDFVCCNRIVWGAQDYKEIRLRHTSGAPDRWLEEVTPVLSEYSEASAAPVVEAIENARAKRIEQDVNDFLAKRFTKSQSKGIIEAHERDELRPIETMWDAVTGITAYARDIPHQDQRVALERKAGELLAA